MCPGQHWFLDDASKFPFDISKIFQSRSIPITLHYSNFTGIGQHAAETPAESQAWVPCNGEPVKGEECLRTQAGIGYASRLIQYSILRVM